MPETTAQLLADLAALGFTVNHLWLADEAVTTSNARCTHANDLSGSNVATPLVAEGAGCKYDATAKAWVHDDVGASPFGFLRSAVSPALDFARAGGFTVALISTLENNGVYATIGDNASSPEFRGQQSVGGQPPGFPGVVLSGDASGGAAGMMVYNDGATLAGSVFAPTAGPYAIVAGERRAWGIAFDKTAGRCTADMMGDWFSDIQWTSPHIASFVHQSGGVAYPAPPAGANRISVLPVSTFGTQKAQGVIVLGANAATDRRFWWRWQRFAEGRFGAKSLAARPKLIVPGDSVTTIALATDGSDALTPYAWTERLQELHPEWDVFSQGVGGWTWFRMLDDHGVTQFDLPNQTIPFLNPNRALVVVGAFEFANMYNNAANSAPSTAQDIYNATKAYFQAAASQAAALGADANLKLALITAPSNNVAGGIETVWAKRSATRDLYLADHSWVDALIDTIGGPTTVLGANAAGANATYFIDGTHLTHVGKVKAGDDLAPSLASLIAAWNAMYANANATLVGELLFARFSGTQPLAGRAVTIATSDANVAVPAASSGVTGADGVFATSRTRVGPGTCMFTATCDGLSATITITVS